MLSIISQAETTAAVTGPRSRVVLPIQTGLRTIQYMGNDLQESRRNRRARDALSASVIGAPTISADRATFDPSTSNYFVWDSIVETADFTLFVVARALAADLAPSANRPHVVGWSVSGSGGYITAGTGVSRFLVGYANASTGAEEITTASVTNDHTTPQLLMAVVKQGVGSQLFNLTTGVSGALVPSTLVRKVNAGRGLRVGGGNAAPLGPCSVWTMIAHDAALTLEQGIQQMVPVRKRLSLLYGLTV